MAAEADGSNFPYLTDEMVAHYVRGQSTYVVQKFTPRTIGGHEGKRYRIVVNMGVEPRTLALLAPRSKPTELIDLSR